MSSEFSPTSDPGRPPNPEGAFAGPGEELAEAELDIATQSLARPAAVMAVGTALSRLTGLGRFVALALALGVAESRLGDSYNLASTLPFVFYELVLGGILSSIFIPVVVQELRTKEQRDAWRSVSALVTAALGMLLALALILIAAAPLIMDLFGSRLPGGSEAVAQESLTTFLLRIFAIQIALYGFTAIGAGLLNAHGRFAVPMFAPIVNNVVVIGGFLLFAALVSGVPTQESVEQSGWQKWLLGLGATGGVVAMCLVYLPFLRRLPGRLRIRVNLRHPAVRKLARLSVWTVVYVAINAIGTVISFFLANQLQGGITAYVLAFAFFQLPIGIAAVSISTALVPKLSAHFVDADMPEFRARLAGGIRVTALLLLPATAAYIVLAEPIVSLLLEHGIVGAESADLVADTLRYFAIGLLPFAVFQLMTRGFYTRQDARAPALINIVEVGVTVALDFALFGVLDVRGLALAHSLGYVVGTAVAWVWLTRDIGSLAGHGIATEVAKMTVAAGVMAAAMLGARELLEGAVDSEFLQSLLEVAVAGGVGVATFFGLAWVLRVPDLAEFKRLVPGRR